MYLRLFLSLSAVLKRGKVKKGKNDLIGAEEGEDPFADISSVGKLNISVTHGHHRIPSDLHMLSVLTVDLYVESHHKRHKHVLWLPGL